MVVVTIYAATVRTTGEFLLFYKGGGWGKLTFLTMGVDT